MTVTRSQLKNGVYAAALTPLKANHDPDFNALTTHLRWLMDNGCDGIALLGTTGEATSQAVNSRLRIIEAVANTNLAPDRVLTGTGTCSTGETIELTRCAVALGYPNVLVLPPFYYKNVSDDGLFAYFSTIVEQVNNPDLRLYLYHFPQMSAVPISFELIARLRQAHGEIVAGLKDSSGDWANTKALLEEFPGFRVFSGSEQFLADNLNIGGPGCISATVNVTASLAAKVANSAGSDRQEAQGQLTRVRQILQNYPLVAALKQIMNWHTGRASWNTVLPPLTALSKDQSSKLWQQISSEDFFRRDFCLDYR